MILTQSVSHCSNVRIGFIYVFFFAIYIYILIPNCLHRHHVFFVLHIEEYTIKKWVKICGTMEKITLIKENIYFLLIMYLVAKLLFFIYWINTCKLSKLRKNALKQQNIRNYLK